MAPFDGADETVQGRSKLIEFARALVLGESGRRLHILAESLDLVGEDHGWLGVEHATSLQCGELVKQEFRSRSFGHHRGDATSFGSVVTHDELHEWCLRPLPRKVALQAPECA